MEEIRLDPRLPEGFRECLQKNGKALEWWSALTERERERRLREIRPLRGGELEDYVNGMVGMEKGHPPYDL